MTEQDLAALAKRWLHRKELAYGIEHTQEMTDIFAMMLLDYMADTKVLQAERDALKAHFQKRHLSHCPAHPDIATCICDFTTKTEP